MIVGVDCDGVLSNFNDPYIKLLERVTGKRLFPEDWYVNGAKPTTWNYPLDHGYSKEEYSNSWEAIKEDKKFWLSLPPLPGMAELRSISPKHTIYFITTRVGKTAHYQTKHWLMRNGFIDNDVLVTSEKGPIARALKLEVFIDDKPENIQEVLRDSPSTRCYLLDQPYNQQCEDGIRVFSVNEFLTMEKLNYGR